MHHCFILHLICEHCHCCRVGTAPKQETGGGEAPPAGEEEEKKKQKRGFSLDVFLYICKK